MHLGMFIKIRRHPEVRESVTHPCLHEISGPADRSQGIVSARYPPRPSAAAAATLRLTGVDLSLPGVADGACWTLCPPRLVSGQPGRLVETCAERMLTDWLRLLWLVTSCRLPSPTGVMDSEDTGISRSVPSSTAQPLVGLDVLTRNR